jgi:hypothetical protein
LARRLPSVTSEDTTQAGPLAGLDDEPVTSLTHSTFGVTACAEP